MACVAVTAPSARACLPSKLASTSMTSYRPYGLHLQAVLPISATTCSRGIRPGSCSRPFGGRQTLRRAMAPQQQQQQQQQQQREELQQAPDFIRLPPEMVAAGGLVCAEQSPEDQHRLEYFLKNNFVLVDLATPGLCLLNVDPPIFSIPGFLTQQECDDLVNAALDAPGAMSQSSVGTAQGGAAAGGEIRTSETLNFNSDKLSKWPHLVDPLDTLLAKAQALLPMRGINLLQSRKDGFKKPARAGDWACEQPQLARYSAGQHFLTHFDSFPRDIVAQKGYQRKATLLVYLNDVEKGGGTHFNLMDLRVQPKKGSALLFFPGFKNGMPDPRLPHTAEDAEDEKWVSQLWVVEGVGKGGAKASQPKASSRGKEGPKRTRAQRSSHKKKKK
mmetsp:Transcript_3531/g.10169  ORF Transcript_3531/g.10169 Transcript_3531/m.10169 type:complete len:388 (+) Transcript_3531:65-1228(+)